LNIIANTQKYHESLIAYGFINEMSHKDIAKAAGLSENYFNSNFVNSNTWNPNIETIISILNPLKISIMTFFEAEIEDPKDFKEIKPFWINSYWLFRYVQVNGKNLTTEEKKIYSANAYKGNHIRLEKLIIASNLTGIPIVKILEDAMKDSINYDADHEKRFMAQLKEENKRKREERKKEKRITPYDKRRGVPRK